jgi:hypothetical protein
VSCFVNSEMSCFVFVNSYELFTVVSFLYVVMNSCTDFFARACQFVCDIRMCLIDAMSFSEMCNLCKLI